MRSPVWSVLSVAHSHVYGLSERDAGRHRRGRAACAEAVGGRDDAREDEQALHEVERVESQLVEAEDAMSPMARKEMYVRSMKAPRGERDLRGS